MSGRAVRLLRTAVAAKVPARPDCRIESKRAVRAEIGRSDIVVVAAEPVHLVLGHAKLEILWQLDAKSDRAFKGDSRHRGAVLELRHVISKRKCGREKEERMARKRLSEGLNFEVAAPEVTRVGVACGIGAAGTHNRGERWIATAQVRLIVRRREGKVRISAH